MWLFCFWRQTEVGLANNDFAEHKSHAVGRDNRNQTNRHKGVVEMPLNDLGGACVIKVHGGDHANRFAAFLNV